MNTTINTLKIGDQLTYNYYGVTYTSTVKAIRAHSMNAKTWLVYTEQHEVAVDVTGSATQFNGYSTSFVKCDDNEATRAAFATLETAFGKDSQVMKQMWASVRIS